MTDKSQSPPRPRGHVRKFARRAIIFLSLSLVGIAFLPNIVAYLGLAAPILQAVMGDAIGDIEVESASLGWLRPVELQGVHVSRPDGVLDASAQSILVSRSLLNLVFSSSDLGEISIEQLSLRALVAESASQSQSPESSLASLPVGRWLDDLTTTIRVNNGNIHIEDQQNRSTIQLADVQWTLLTSPAEHMMQTTLSARVVGGLPDARLNTTLDLSIDPNDGTVSSIGANIESKLFPLAMANALLSAADQDTRLAGALTCDLKLHYQTKETSVQAIGNGHITEFALDSGMLESDRLALSRLDFTLNGRTSASGLELDDVQLKSELGLLTGKGRLTLDTSGTMRDRSLVLDGELDLPALARQLPHLLRMREDVDITRGKLVLSVRPVGETSDWVDLTLNARDLEAARRGERITWPQPVHMTARVGTSATGGWSAEKLEASADFFKLKGSGSIESFDVTVVCDLSRMHQRLGQLLDLDDVQASGRATARLQTQRAASGGIIARGAARGENLSFIVDAHPLITETLINAQLQASLSSDLDVLESLHGVLKTDKDELDVRLAEKISPGIHGKWNLSVSGQLGEFARRMAPWMPGLNELRLEGVGSAQGALRLTEAQVELRRCVVNAKDFRVQGSSFRLAEPEFHLETSGSWDFKASRADLATTVVKTPSLQATTSQLTIVSMKDGWSVNGGADIVADLARVRGWTTSDPAALDWGGMFRGRLSCRAENGEWLADIQGMVDEARLGPQAEPYVLEPRVEVALNTRIDFSSDKVHLEQIRLSSGGIAASARGQVAELSKRQVIQLTGEMEFDLATLTPRLRSLLGDQVSFEGRDTRPFRLEGPLQPSAGGVQFAAGATPSTAAGSFPGLSGEFSAAWTRANIYGFEAGPASIDARLQQSWLITRPVTFKLNQGNVELKPGVFFGDKATYFHHPAAQVVDRVELTRQMCDGALQYVAPILAKTLDVQGKASLSISEVQFPLGRMGLANFSGSLTLHNVQATGSPLMQELLALSDGKPVVELGKESVVPFRVQDGKVHHEKLEIRFPGAVMTTSGWVGFDRSLGLVAETPIPKRWFKSDQMAQRFAGQKIRIPVGGTLDRPKLDKSALQREAGRMIEESAGRVIEGEINKQLDRFLEKLK